MYARLVLFTACLILAPCALLGFSTDGQNASLALFATSLVAAGTNGNTAITVAALGPNGVYYDATFNKLYVSDPGNSRVMRYGGPTFTLNEAAEAAFGCAAALTSACAGAAATTGQFATPGGAQPTPNGPNGLATDGTGALYVADNTNDRISKIPTAHTSAGNAAAFTATWSNAIPAAAGTCAANNGFAAGVQGLTWHNNKLWACGNGDHACLRFDDALTKTVTTNTVAIAKLGTCAGANTATQLNGPVQIVFDASGNGYVSNITGLRILRFSAATVNANLLTGNTAVAVIAAANLTSAGGASSTAATTVGAAAGMTIDGAGNLIVVDSAGTSVMKLFKNPATIATAGTASNITGVSTFGGVAGATTNPNDFNTPTYVSFDADNSSVWLSDSANDRVLSFACAAASTTPSATPSRTPSASTSPSNAVQTVTPSPSTSLAADQFVQVVFTQVGNSDEDNIINVAAVRAQFVSDLIAAVIAHLASNGITNVTVEVVALVRGSIVVTVRFGPTTAATAAAIQALFATVGADASTATGLAGTTVTTAAVVSATPVTASVTPTPSTSVDVPSPPSPSPNPPSPSPNPPSPSPNPPSPSSVSGSAGLTTVLVVVSAFIAAAF